MDVATLLAYSGGSLAMGLLSGLVPAFNTEAYLLMVALVAPPESVLAAVVFVTVGQMAAKWLLYLAGSGVVGSRLLAAHVERLDVVRQRLGQQRAGSSVVVFASAVAGVPPFYLVSVAAGSLRYSLSHFLLVGATGRLLRFSAVVAASKLLGGFS